MAGMLAALVLSCAAAAADSAPGGAPAGGDALAHPEKLGVGAVMLRPAIPWAADLDRLGPNWFYNWQLFAPEIRQSSWLLQRPAAPAGVDDAPPQAPRFHLKGSGPAELRVTDLTADGAALRTASYALKHAATLELPPAPDDAASRRIEALTRAGSRLEVLPPDAAAPEQGWKITCDAARSIPEPGRAFVPMVWGRYDVALLALGAPLPPGDTLLAFNEPDLMDQSGMSVEEAIILWPTLMAAGRRLSSPATTSGSTVGANSWLGRFMGEADARGYRVDFIAVHYYTANPDVGAFRAFLERVHAAYGRPIWVTEWALADWATKHPMNAAAQRTFFLAAARMMDALPYVERHAWFSTYRTSEATVLNSEMMDDAGALTPLGSDFLRLANPPEPGGNAARPTAPSTASPAPRSPC